jgi:hypothetical protein
MDFVLYLRLISHSCLASFWASGGYVIIHIILSATRVDSFVLLHRFYRHFDFIILMHFDIPFLFVLSLTIIDSFGHFINIVNTS